VSEKKIEKNFVTENRVGMVVISEKMYEDFPEKALRLFSQVAVIRCEYMYINKSFQIVGYSPLFEELERGMMCPEYQVLFEGDRLIMKKHHSYGSK